ncbi:hypothetical protein K502DRAFT_319991 [Neoconidiobolus thromboides FSU 785]|nr:hypothetical protein K502DRAFT_319991 [Neoconidiobolus thromboides FSU 785]
MLLINQLILALLPLSVYSINRIEIKGSKFFDSETGEQFFMKGVAYQPRAGGNYDPLADAEGCKRDIKYLKDLGVNTVRVYESYPWNNHDECMKLLEEANIYLLLDLAIPKRSINRMLPFYDTDILVHFKQNIDSFSKFKNLIGFFAGNEVTNDKKTTPASAHIKAILRDTKAYIKNKGLKIPVGYANNDDPDVRNMIQDYFNCGKDEERADFYGINIYAWCGDSSMQKSGYDKRTEEVKNYSIPSILSEFGCNVITPRPFGDLDALYGEEMASVWSGGIVYEFTEEANNYGLVEIKNGKVKTLPDFDVVKSKFKDSKPKGTNKGDYNPKSKKSNCPSVEDDWKASEKLPPTPNEDACKCMFESLACQVNDNGQAESNGEKVGKLIGQTCGDGVCDLIKSDTEKGEYGDFSICDATTRNSIVFSEAVKKGAKCDFNGFASSNKKTNGKDSKECSKLNPNLKSAPKAKKIDGTTEKKSKNSNSSKDEDDSDDKSGSKDGKNGASYATHSMYTPLFIFGFIYSLLN